jgi:pentapeptide MXKDX repeat protein
MVVREEARGAEKRPNEKRPKEKRPNEIRPKEKDRMKKGWMKKDRMKKDQRKKDRRKKDRRKKDQRKKDQRKKDQMKKDQRKKDWPNMADFQLKIIINAWNQTIMKNVNLNNNNIIYIDKKWLLYRGKVSVLAKRGYPTVPCVLTDGLGLPVQNAFSSKHH